MPIPPDLIDSCGEDLVQMNFFKTPRSKLICISNCSIKIFRALEKHTGMPVPLLHRPLTVFRERRQRRRVSAYSDIRRDKD